MRFITSITLLFILTLSAKSQNNVNISKTQFKNIIEKTVVNRQKIKDLNDKNFNNYNKVAISDTKNFLVLDSLVLDLTAFLGTKSLFIFEYDARGNNLSSRDFTVSDVEGTVETAKALYKYDSNKNLIEIEYSYLDEEMGEWINDEKIQYIYINNQLSETIEFIDNGDSWVEDTKTEYIYNQDGTVAEELISNYYEEWNLNTKITHTYENDKLTMSEEFEQLNDTWELMTKIEYIYENELLVEESTLEYYEDQATETNTEIYEYDNQGRVTKHQTYTIWYDELELVTESNYKYDVNGNMIEEAQAGINEDGEFANTLKMSYTYDLTVDQDQLLLPYDDGDEFMSGSYSNMPIQFTMEIWYDLLNDWLDLGITGDFYFNEKTITLNVKDIKNSNINIYPNPVIETINVDLDYKTSTADFKLFDLNGKEVKSQNLMKNNQVNIETLLPGTYVYIITENGIPFSGKILKE